MDRPTKARRRLLHLKKPAPLVEAAIQGSSVGTELSLPQPAESTAADTMGPVAKVASENLTKHAASPPICLTLATAVNDESVVGGRLRKLPATSDEVLAMRALRGDVDGQLAFLSTLGFPEPRVVSVDSLSRLGSLLRARREWINMGEKPEQSHVASVSGKLRDWNKRDPLSSDILNASTARFEAVARRGAPIVFAALDSTLADDSLPEPLSEGPPRAIQAMIAFAGHGTMSNCGLHFLVPSLAAPVDDPVARAAAAAAMALYLQCCQTIMTFGPLPECHAKSVGSLETAIIDLEPKQKDKTVEKAKHTIIDAATGDGERRACRGGRWAARAGPGGGGALQLTLGVS